MENNLRINVKLNEFMTNEEIEQIEQIEQEEQSKRSFSIFHGDITLWIVYFLFCVISIVEVFSALSMLTYAKGEFFSDITKHIFYLTIGFLIALITHNIPCRWFKYVGTILWIISTIFLVVVLLLPNNEVNGAQRTFEIFGFNIQPSEFAKGAVVLVVAFILSFMQTNDGADRRTMKYILWITLIPTALILKENFSTAAILLAVVFLMMFIGRIPFDQLGKLIGVIVLLGGLLLGFCACFPEKAKDYGLGRGTTWVTRLTDFKGQNDGDTTKVAEEPNAQVLHANIAIASSNVIGKMPGNSVERDFLPQAFSDYIYAIIVEELGLAGGVFVIFLYVVILFRAAKIAKRCERSFPAFAVLGLALLICIQALAHICVNVGLAPVTGQPLPLISRGGSSIIVTSFYFGVMLSVSRFAKKKGNIQPVEEVPFEIISGDTIMVNEEEFTNDKGID